MQVCEVWRKVDRDVVVGLLWIERDIITTRM